ncbi:Proteinase (Secreted protein) [Paramicrosporidium saccamoebae]|uniref:Proteinase (Secreted protein) n=1 Tax=Paramicrosporidium saccamoebae TaxID=1246581 RepID=A0A2H9TK81_9FUNG|nr:Proteinase (Secreted protein) [Paramicrosporidium saccamoebae]
MLRLTVVLFSLLLCILPIVCFDARDGDIQKLRKALNRKERLVSLPENFKLSPKLFNGLTLDGAKTLLEILDVHNYDEHTKAPTNIDRDKEMVTSSPLTDELVLAMGPDVCALFADHHQLLEHPEVTLNECISVFIANLNASEHPREMLKRLPMNWFTHRPVELLTTLMAKQHLSSVPRSTYRIDLDDEFNCQKLTVDMALKLIRLNVIPSSKCISKISDLNTMEASASHRLISLPTAFRHYNGPLSESVTTVMSENHLRNYASKVKGDIICQNLRLELAKRGIHKVTVRCLHGYFHAGPKPLDISEIPSRIIKQWISEYPADARNIKPKYLGLLHYSCWEHILKCKANLNKEFLETIIPDNRHNLPSIILDLPLSHRKLIKKHAPRGFLRSVQTQFTTQSILKSLNGGCRKTADQMLKRPNAYTNKFFSGLTVTGAKLLLCSSCGVKNYGSFLQSDTYSKGNIKLKFTTAIEPEQIATRPEVCAVFLHALPQIKDRDQIPTECWELHINELIKFGTLNTVNFKLFPKNVLKSRAADLFILFKSKGLRMRNFHSSLVKAATKDSKACSKMKLDYFIPYPFIIPPECVARLSDLGNAGDKAFKNLGPDAFSYYDGSLSDALLKKITKDQLASFGAQLGKDKVCNEIRLHLLAENVIESATLSCIRGSFSKPTSSIGPSFKNIPENVLVQWMQRDPQNFRNIAISDRPEIAQSVWMSVLQYPKLDLTLAKQLFGGQDDIGLPNLPSYKINRILLSALLDRIPLLGHALMVKAKTLPKNLFAVLGPIITEGITVCHQKRAGIHLLATLENVGNAASIISNIPQTFCASLRKGEYLRYTWLRANFSEECRKNLQFPSDHLTPELSSDPRERSKGLKELKDGRTPRPSPLDLKEMLTDIIWSNCDNTHYSRGRICARGKLRVPSNYLDPEGGSFTLTIYRYTQHNQTPRAHLIFLAGGPGGPGLLYRYKATLISELTKGDVATYLVDHRGLGESGQFTEIRGSWEAETFDLKSTFANRKFDEKDLRLEPAALDVAMVGLALKRSNPKARLSVYGFSYGALWAHEAVRFVPDLFDSAILGGVPALKGVMKEKNLRDILEHCRLDSFCRSKMGSDVLDSFPKMVEQLGNPETNECVKMMHSGFGIAGNTAEERVEAIANHFCGFVLDSPPAKAAYTNIQILLPFVKATIDCGNAETYSLHVIGRSDNASQPATLDDYDFNSFVHEAVTSDHHVPPMESFNLYPPDLHPYYFYAKDIHQLPFCRYCLVGRNRNSPEPLVTKKTAFYFLQGLFDVQTPFNIAKQVFDSVKAPLKVFQPVNNRGHGDFGLGETEYIIAAVYGQSVKKAQTLIEESAESRPMKWEFAGNENLLGKIWTMVNDASVNEPVQGNLPKMEMIQTGPITSMEKLKHADQILDAVGKNLRLTGSGIADFKCTKHLIRIPVNYTRSLEKRFNFNVWRCGKTKKARNNHVIMLTDAAEYLTEEHFTYANSLSSKLQCVVYLSQYRGLDEYKKLRNLSWEEAIKTQITPKFKVSNISGEYVANDMALLAMAIKNDPKEWKVHDRLILTGTGLGAQIGYKVAENFPSLFDSTILGNLFGSANDLPCESDSLVDLCAMDPACQRLVGKSDAESAKLYISKSIESLYSKPLNACTRELWRYFKWHQLPKGPSLKIATEDLLPLAAYDPRMLLSFAAISAQCADKQHYKTLLRGAIAGILDKPRPTSNINDFVDSVLRIVAHYQGFLGDHPPILRPFLMKYAEYNYRASELLESFGTVAKCHVQEPAILERGRIYMVQNIVNSDASFSIAEKLYHKTRGEKLWVPLKHATTPKMSHFVEKILEAEIKGSASTVVQDCIDADEKIGTDWKKVWKFKLQ